MPVICFLQNFKFAPGGTQGREGGSKPGRERERWRCGSFFRRKTKTTKEVGLCVFVFQHIHKSACTRKGAAPVGPSLGVPSSSRQAEKTPTYVNDLDLDGALSKHDKKVEFEKKKGQQVMVASFYGSLTVNVPRRSRTNIPMLSALDQPKKVSLVPPSPRTPLPSPLANFLYSRYILLSFLLLQCQKVLVAAAGAAAELVCPRQGQHDVEAAFREVVALEGAKNSIKAHCDSLIRAYILGRTASERNEKLAWLASVIPNRRQLEDAICALVEDEGLTPHRVKEGKHQIHIHGLTTIGQKRWAKAKYILSMLACCWRAHSET